MMKSIFSLIFAATLTLFCISCGFAQNDAENTQESSGQFTTQTEQKQNRYSENLVYVSPTTYQLVQLGRHEVLPPSLTICELCPQSLWTLINNQELNCFCQAMHSLTYQHHQPQSVSQCDQQIRAIEEFLASQQEK